jgi:hypothetical protein
MRLPFYTTIHSTPLLLLLLLLLRLLIYFCMLQAERSRGPLRDAASCTYKGEREGGKEGGREVGAFIVNE